MTSLKRNYQSGEASPGGPECYYYHVKVFTKDQQPFLRQYPEFRKLAEKYWRNVMQMYPYVQSDEFGTQSNCLQAIVRLKIKQEHPALKASNVLAEPDFIESDSHSAVIEKAVSFFHSLSEFEWRKKAKMKRIELTSTMWEPHVEIQSIIDQSELGRVRRAIHSARIRDSINEDYEDDWSESGK